MLFGDRDFATYKYFSTVARNGARFLIRGKTGRGSMKLPATARLPDGSYRSNAGGVQVRVIEATVTIANEASTRTGEYRLITTLLNPGQAPAQQLVALYHDR